MELFPQVVIDEIAEKTNWNDHNGSILTLLLFMRMDGIRGLDGYIDEIQEIIEIHHAARSMSHRFNKATSASNARCYGHCVYELQQCGRSRNGFLNN